MCSARTNAVSSGIELDKATLQAIARKSDRVGLRYVAQWLAVLVATGSIVWLTLDTIWMWPAMFLHGIALTVPAYALSHETAHGSAFRTRWLNEMVFWITSLLYMEEPLHRRFTHNRHHACTWHTGKDSQMPFDTPMRAGGWLMEASGLALLRFHIAVFARLALGRYSQTMRDAAPAHKLPVMTRNARLMLVLYALVAAAPIAGIWWPIWLIIVPRILGAPVMLLFTLIQHVEMQENSPSILDSTRSFRTNPVGRFLYMNMNNHIEHHLYPHVPFHALPALADAVRDQLPAPDPGFFRTNAEVFIVVLKRSLGRATRAPSIRQAAHMISTGGPVESVARRTM